MNFTISIPGNTTGFLRVFTLGLLILGASPLTAQSDTLKKQLQAFLAEQGDDYEKKYLNIAKRNLGSLENEPFDFKDAFMLQSKEKVKNQLGNERYRKIYFNVYEYKTELDRQYALKFWLDDFIEGKSVRAGRPVRSYPYAVPTIILINPTNIVICNYDCKYYDYDNYKYWKKQLKQHFGNYKTMVIEIKCDGPLDWTDNAPDPKTRGLF